MQLRQRPWPDAPPAGSPMTRRDAAQFPAADRGVSCRPSRPQERTIAWVRRHLTSSHQHPSSYPPSASPSLVVVARQVTGLRYLLWPRRENLMSGETNDETKASSASPFRVLRGSPAGSPSAWTRQTSPLPRSARRALGKPRQPAVCVADSEPRRLISLGLRGLADDVLPGSHVCMSRLKLLRNNTIGPRHRPT